MFQRREVPFFWYLLGTVVLLFFIVWVYGSLMHTGSGTGSTTVSHQTTSNPQRATRLDPGVLCNALDSVGIQTAGWRRNPGGAPENYCQSEYVWVGPPHEMADAIRNLVVCSVESVPTDPVVLKTIRLEGRFYRVLPEEELKEKLASATRVLFASQVSETPAGVLDAIDSEATIKVDHALGNVAELKECGPELPMNNRMCSVAVEIRP
jgi:hypothetical protein